MRAVNNWDETYLLNLIPSKEMDWIEVKGRQLLDLTLPSVNESRVRDELSKQVSAFANSGGGYLIYGIEDRQHIVDDGGISRIIKSNGTKEWLEDVIPKIVELPITTFKIHEICPSSQNSSIGPDRALYVVEILDSPLAPHQATDNRYYARVGGKSRPIGHQLVIDIYNRRRDPIIEPLLVIDLDQKNKTVNLNVLLTNIGNVMATYVCGFLWVPIQFMPVDIKPAPRTIHISGNEFFEVKLDNTEQDILKTNYGGAEILGPKRFTPILRNLVFVLGQELSYAGMVAEYPNRESIYFYWEIASDNSPRKKGKVSLSEVIKHSKNFNLV